MEETPIPGEPPEALARRLAIAKASLAVHHHPGRVAVGADTVVALEDQPLGKPESAEDAARMLRSLRGREHRVITAVAAAKDDRFWERTAVTRVWIRDYNDDEIAAYVDTGDPMDKAGAYAIQHAGFHPVLRIDGCYLTVVGLSLPALYTVLTAAGIELPAIPGSRLEEICPGCPDRQILPTA